MNRITSRAAALATTIAVLVLGTAGHALAGPVPVDEGASAGGGVPAPRVDSGVDWTPWLLAAVTLVIVMAVAYLLTNAPRRRPHRPAHA